MNAKMKLVVAAAIAAALAGCSTVSSDKAAAPSWRDSGTHYVRDAVQPYVDKGWCPGAISILYKDGVAEAECIGY